MLIPQELQLSQNSLSRFITRAKHFRLFDYACLSVELLQSSAVDCIVRYRRPYSLLQWTVQSTATDYTVHGGRL